MDRRARIASIWNWLPGFRAVAETENVHEAARQLHVSPSALSRTIRLLEDHVGEQLFERTGRILQLTALGRDLLVVVQRSMRGVDDVLTARAAVPEFLRVAIAGGLAEPVLMATLVTFTRMHGVASLSIAEDPHRDPVNRLLCGDLDVVLTCDPLEDERICKTVVGEMTYGIYAPSDHPVLAAPSLASVLAHPFVSYPVPPARGGDRWPEQLGARTIGMQVHDARLALAACARGWLAVLPEPLLTEAQSRAARVQRVPLDLVPCAALTAMYRRATGARSLAAMLVHALVECRVRGSSIRVPIIDMDPIAALRTLPASLQGECNAVESGVCDVLVDHRLRDRM